MKVYFDGWRAGFKTVLVEKFIALDERRFLEISLNEPFKQRLLKKTNLKLFYLKVITVDKYHYYVFFYIILKIVINPNINNYNIRYQVEKVLFYLKEYYS